jgi:release factor glutamine methyltransferase
VKDAPCADPAGSIGFFLCQAGQRLRGAAIEAPRLEARRLLAHVLGTTEEALLRDPRAPVPADKAAQFAGLLARRVAHEPFAYLIGHVGFWTLELEVSPATLIPRADSESLIEAALEACPDKGAALNVIDLGTGTGALLLALLSELPAASGVGVDLKPEAAALAARNAARLGLADRACFLAGDWAAALSGRFDLLLCNPPYIETVAIPALMPEVARHEPASALDGGADGLSAYRHIIADLPRLLAPRGVAVLELGQGQQAAVEALARAVGLMPAACRADLGGVPRALVLRAA